MIGSFLKILFGRLVPALVLFVAIFIGWCNLDPDSPWEARLFVVVMPLMKGGYLPPILFGNGKLGAKMTPPVPADLTPQPRPENELFATLEGSGDSMPLNGIGMCCRATAYDDICVERTIEWFLLMGGRHIDGAHIYLNHEAIGKGIQNAIHKGVSRDEIFLTTKVYPTQFGYQATRDVVESSLKDLGQDYVDMVLLHSPARMLPGPHPSGCKGLTNEECRQDAWKALSELRSEGKIRNAGVSNFRVKHLEGIVDLHKGNSSKIAPISNNQIPWNPWAGDEYVKTVQYCKAKNIQITAYNSLGGTTLESEKAMKLETLISLSEKHGRSIQQIMLRWSIQSGAAIIPGTGNPKYMAENLKVYEFELSEADMKSIDDIREEILGEFLPAMGDDVA
jgi:diketogulonate reductase-like aldo/keto reductase